MKIAICVKQVSDVTGPFTVSDEMTAFNARELVPIVNPADLAGLALTKTQLATKPVTIKAVTLGPACADQALRECLALGADDALRIWDKDIEPFSGDPDTVARLLAAAITQGESGVDLVVCGNSSLDNGSGYVGPAVAKYLGYAYVGGVSRIEICRDGKSLSIYRRKEYGDREIVVVQLPALITVDDGAAEVPYASLPELIAAEQYVIPVLDLPTMGLKKTDIKKSTVTFKDYMRPKPRAKKSAAAAGGANPLMAMLQGGGGKSGSVVTGTPEKAAAEIISFLKKNEVLG
jgi:electron transfer flavoprotein beta subunit